MNASIARTLVRAGRSSCVGASKHITQVTTRSTSWIGFEMPNPALYIPSPPTTHEKELEELNRLHLTHGVAEKEEKAEKVVAPATAALPLGSQEISISGKTARPSVPAGNTRTPLTQKRSFTQLYHSAETDTEAILKKLLEPEPEFQASPMPKDDYLPITHLCLPGLPATWPVDVPEIPRQKTVRNFTEKGFEARKKAQAKEAAAAAAEKPALAKKTVKVTQPDAGDDIKFPKRTLDDKLDAEPLSL
ncbi:hypothetical protein F4780DRAFT_551678 [Xylariomycetidae sp. FL0641]|nr:hypothetical protein F4780DRAFT_551678 [Xylariomycetidae sp. FL0641]